MDSAREDIDALYADFGDTVCRQNGAPSFLALWGAEDVDTFSTGTRNEHTIRYPAEVELSEGEIVAIDCRTYKVPRTVPRRINDGRELVLELIPQ